MTQLRYTVPTRALMDSMDALVDYIYDHEMKTHGLTELMEIRRQISILNIKVNGRINRLKDRLDS